MIHKRQELACQKKKNGKITLTKEQMRGAVITSHCELSVVEGCLIDAVNQNYFQSRNPGNLVVVFISNKEREKKINSSWVSSYEVWFGSHPVLLLGVIDLLPNIHESVKVVKAVKRQQEKLARKDLSPHCADTLPIHGKSFGW